MSLSTIHYQILLPILMTTTLLVGCGRKESAQQQASDASSPELMASESGDAALEAASDASDASIPDGASTEDAATGVALYYSVCASCHADGTGQAPRFNNQSDWQSRIGQGEDALLQSVLNGKGIMPAKGTAMNATPAELRAAVRYMLANVGTKNP